MSWRGSAEVRDTDASVHRRICIVMLQFYIQGHETLLKANIRHKLFNFQPWSLTVEKLWINLSLKRTLQKRKWTLHSFIQLINRLLTVLTLKHGLGDPCTNPRAEHPSVAMPQRMLPLAMSSIPGEYPCNYFLPAGCSLFSVSLSTFPSVFFFPWTKSQVEQTQPVAVTWVSQVTNASPPWVSLLEHVASPKHSLITPGTPKIISLSHRHGAASWLLRLEGICLTLYLLQPSAG